MAVQSSAMRETPKKVSLCFAQIVQYSEIDFPSQKRYSTWSSGGEQVRYMRAVPPITKCHVSTLC